jgi:hypothetical protein
MTAKDVRTLRLRLSVDETARALFDDLESYPQKYRAKRLLALALQGLLAESRGAGVAVAPADVMPPALPSPPRVAEDDGRLDEDTPFQPAARSAANENFLQNMVSHAD